MSGYSQAELLSLNALVAYCSRFNVSEKIAKRLFEIGDGIDTLDILKRDPFGYIETVSRYTIDHAEKLAKHIPMDDPRRLKAYILVSLIDVLGDAYEYRNNSGDTWVRFSQLKQAFAKRFGAKHNFDKCLAQSNAVVEGEKVTSKLLHEAEMTIAEWLIEAKEKHSDGSWADLYAAAMEKLEASNFSDEQKRAIAGSVAYEVSVVTGSAGTGKTHVVKGIYSLNHSTILLAPTGAAAKRMTFMTGQHAYTIHLAILSPTVNQLLANANLVVIDETSMMDVIIFAKLLRFLQYNNPSARVVLVGDEHQLKSVQAGAVLRDICATVNVVPIQRLTKNYRQGAGSVIAENAKKIWNNQLNLEQVEGQFEIIQVTDMVGMWQILKEEPTNLAHAIISAQNRSFGWGVDPLNFLCQYWHNNPVGRRNETEYNSWRNQGDIFILKEDIASRTTQFYAGEVGRIVNSDQHNRKITLEFDGPTITMPIRDFEAKTVYKKVFRPGDVVMHLDNDRNTGLVNGDIGTVVTCSKSTVTVDFVEGDNTRMVTVKRDKKDKKFPLTLAYVYTCNKMQGNEKPLITIVLTSGFYSQLVTADWLATAVTRGQQRVRIIHDGCLNKVIKRQARPRKTRLNEFVDRLN